MDVLPLDSTDVTLAQNYASPVCKHFQTGFCKFADKCKRQHEKEICQTTHCSLKTCRKRHPKLCKFFSLNHFCKFGDLCCYKHLIAESQSTPHLLTVLQTKVDEMEQIIKSLQSEIVALRDINKCEVCDYMATSSTSLKAHTNKKHKHASQAVPMENERSKLNDDSLNASLLCEERQEYAQLNDSVNDNIEDDPTKWEWSSFVFPPSTEEILCHYDDCGEEFFLDHRFAMHVYNIHKLWFKCDHCNENIPGCLELEEIHMKICSISCTDTHCSTGNPKYSCPF